MDVLIVDDSDLLRKRIKSLFYENSRIDIIAEAAKANEALDILNKNYFDIVSLDIRLPDENGLVVLKKIKSDFPLTKVIVFSNYFFPQYITKAKRLGAEYFFSKMTDFNLLNKTINEIIDSSEKLNSDQYLNS